MSYCKDLTPEQIKSLTADPKISVFIYVYAKSEENQNIRLLLVANL